jgi:hypothetical protein
MAEYDNREKETVFAAPPVYILSRHGAPWVRRLYSTEEEAMSDFDNSYGGPNSVGGVVAVRATWIQRDSITEYQNGAKLPVWFDMPWWRDNAVIHAEHRVRVSDLDPRQLAYYQSPEKAAIGLRTRLKPGRYLSKYFADILSEKERARMARWQETGALDTDYDNDNLYPFALAKDEDEITEVYEQGPHSCMSGPADDEDGDFEGAGGRHPATVYAAGDLAIAYLSDENDKPVARALCWPERKVFGRVYPTPDVYTQDGFASRADSEAMQSALTNRMLAMGWHRDNDREFRDARLRKVVLGDSSVLMPYLDNQYTFSDSDDGFVMSRGGHSATRTDGTAEYYGNTRGCDRCGGRFDADDMNEVFTSTDDSGGRHSEDWCDCCVSAETFYCEGFNERFANSVSHVEVDGETYTRRYARQNFTVCAHSGDWFSDEPVMMENGEEWSTESFADYGFTCLISGNNYPITERHPDHTNIHQDVDQEELADWIASNPRIDDARKTELIAGE